ncbi:alpha/beta hydrolase family protein [Massilia horti]|uniref:Alpha/beta hydrolase n=1 Tax=Massilia horti TaxID=2562153 RepID=A0A4Y9T2B6_9BURK|nr:alpha/beta fold hydrolase [Massilia horti]TFW32033.1 alpha/beta hydrolase [Massilia horti]
MKTTLIGLAAVAVMANNPARAEDAEGYWSGTIANSLKVFVQFSKPADGPWQATLSVPQQGLVTKVENVVVTPDQVSFALPKLNASYAAHWNVQDKAWVGTWTQGRSTPLIFKRADQQALAALNPKRPQEEQIAARAPIYTSSEVSFANDAANVKLAGTLTVPQGTGPFPAVVLVHGSGSHTRDEEVFGHKVFLVLADHLARQGIAVLRYDKRGVAKSSGNLKDATTLDLAADAEAAVRFLRGRAEIDTKRVGLIGHSEGGLIAPLLASRDPALGFVVMLAGPGVRGDRLLVEQVALMSKAQGAPDAAVAKQRALNQALFAAFVAEPKLEDATNKAALILDEAERKGDVPAGQGKVLLQRYATPWFHALLRYDPAPVLQAVQQPILVLNGELDLQVPAAMDLSAIRAALQGNPRAVVKEMPKLNHLFQTARTGSGAEYAEIEETMAPIALSAISDWIIATAR